MASNDLYLNATTIDGKVHRTPHRDEQSVLKEPKTWHCSSNLQSDMLRMFEEELMTDITFLVGTDSQQQTMRANTSVLLLRAPGMKDMIDLAMTDSIRKVVYVPDIDPRHFRSLLKFIYANDASFIETTMDIQGLLVVADRFGCWRLKLLLEATMIQEDLGNDSYITMLMFAAAHDCFMLKEAAIGVIKNQSVPAFVANADFSKLIEHGELMKEIGDFTLDQNHDKGDSGGDGMVSDPYSKLSIGELYMELEKHGIELKTDGNRATLISNLPTPNVEVEVEDSKSLSVEAPPWLPH